MTEAGYSEAGAAVIKDEVTFYENLRSQVKLHSGDAIDLKQYEPAMRHLIDTYIRAEDSVTVSELDDLSLVQLIVERGVKAVEALPASIRKTEKAVAETIENNVRRLIIDESPINPKYYEKISELLDALIAQRKEGALAYKDYLAKVVELTRQAKAGPSAGGYPSVLTTKAQRSLFDNLGRNEDMALRVDQAVRTSMQDDWRSSAMKTRRVRQAIATALGGDATAEQLDATLELVKSQNVTDATSLTVAGLHVSVVRKPIKNLHLGVYPPDGRVRVAAPVAVSDAAVRAPSSAGCDGSSRSKPASRGSRGSRHGR